MISGLCCVCMGGEGGEVGAGGRVAFYLLSTDSGAGVSLFPPDDALGLRLQLALCSSVQDFIATCRPKSKSGCVHYESNKST